MAFISLVFIACNTAPNKLSDEEIASQFYYAYNTSDFEQLKKYSSDSIVIKEGIQLWLLRLINCTKDFNTILFILL